MADTKISALTTDSAPDRVADYVPTYDASAVATKKVLLSQVGSYPIPFDAFTFSPADATTYYLGSFPGLSPTSAFPTLRRIYIPRAGKVIAAYTYWIATTSYGTGETSTVYFRLNNTSDTIISSSVSLTANGAYNNTSMSVAVSAGDYFEIKWVTPTWATNPVGVNVTGTIWIA